MPQPFKDVAPKTISEAAQFFNMNENLKLLAGGKG